MKHSLTIRALLFAAALLAALPGASGPRIDRASRSGAAVAAPAGSGGAAQPEGAATDAGNAHLPTPSELKLGRDGSAEAEKQYKVVKDGTQVKRVQAIADEIVRAANHPEIIRAYLAESKLPRPKDTSRRVAF